MPLKNYVAYNVDLYVYSVAHPSRELNATDEMEWFGDTNEVTTLLDGLLRVLFEYNDNRLAPQLPHLKVRRVHVQHALENVERK
jgi:hypothetical protein